LGQGLNGWPILKWPSSPGGWPEAFGVIALSKSRRPASFVQAFTCFELKNVACCGELPILDDAGFGGQFSVADTSRLLPGLLVL
jgi:hypothetical protein